MDVSRYTDTTHAIWSAEPSSPAIVGSAVASTLCSIDETNSPIIKPAISQVICDRVSAPDVAAVGAGAVIDRSPFGPGAAWSHRCSESTAMTR